jgi:hypothetical protein
MFMHMLGSEAHRGRGSRLAGYLQPISRSETALRWLLLPLELCNFASINITCLILMNVQLPLLEFDGYF